MAITSSLADTCESMPCVLSGSFHNGQLRRSIDLIDLVVLKFVGILWDAESIDS